MGSSMIFNFVCSICICSVISVPPPFTYRQSNNNNNNENNIIQPQINPLFSYLPPSFNYTNSNPSPVLAPTYTNLPRSYKSDFTPQFQQKYIQPPQYQQSPTYNQPHFIPNPFYNGQQQQLPQSPYGYTTVPQMIYVDPTLSYNFNKAPMYMRRRTVQDLCAAYAPEEKTVIYVLSQKPEYESEEIVTPAPTKPSKPEVFFIRYKTPEEADFAQKHIQAQYDALGGTSEISNEGVASVSSFEGALNNNNQYLNTSSSNNR